MGQYVPILSEFVGFFMYMIILTGLYIFLLAWVVDKEKHGEIFKWGSVVSAILGCLTTWAVA